MEYKKVAFSFPVIQEYQKDLLIAALAEVGFDSFADTEDGFDAFIIADQFNETAFNTVLMDFGDELQYTWTLHDIAAQNWNAEWEKNFSPLLIGDQCYVRATFHEAQPQYPYEIVIDPKMAFGTGHHQTTSMMMAYILENDMQDKVILDMGAGTGILAILAAKRGARALTAIDYDEICYQSAIENAALNGVANLHSLWGGKEVIPDGPFDLIFANINRNILLDQIARYAAVLKKGGQVFYSGFYESPDLEMITAENARYGLRYVDHKKNGDWVAARFNF